MSKTWILLADRAGARLYENDGPGKGLHLIQDIPHPQGRLKNQDINADKPGRSFDSHGQGRHAMSKEHEPVEQVAIQFAQHLSHVLDQGRGTNRYKHLVLAAEPRFLGELRAALNAHTAALVAGSLDHDLMHVQESELPQRLSAVLKL